MSINLSIQAWFWFFAHMAAVLFYFRGARHYLTVLVLLLLIPVYFSGNFIGDVANNYIYSINAPSEAGFEIGFVWLVDGLKQLGLHNESLIYFIQFLCGLLHICVFILWRREKTPLLFAATFAMLAVSFFLATQNVIRQGISSAMIAIAIYLWWYGAPIISIFFAIIAQAIHSSSMTFIATITFSCFIFEYAEKKYLRNLEKSKLFFLVILYITLTILICLLIQKLWGEYLLTASRNNERFLGIEKVLIIGFVFFVTQILWSGRIADLMTQRLFFLRATFLAVFISLSMDLLFIEVASRVLFFYFMIEALCALRMLSSLSHPLQLIGAIFLVIVYGVSLNVLTLLEQHLV